MRIRSILLAAAATLTSPVACSSSPKSPASGADDSGSPTTQPSGGDDGGGGTTPPPTGGVSVGSDAGGVPGATFGPGTTVAGCEIFPTNNPWNVQIDGANVKVITTYDS